MKKQLVTYLKFLIFLILAAVLLYIALSGQDIGRIKEAVISADYNWVLLAVVLGTLSHISRAVRWNMLIRPLGYAPKLHNTFLAVMIGYFANLAFPRLGEISKCGVLNRYENIPINKMLGTMIIERAVDLFTLFIIFFLIIFTQFRLLTGFIMENLAEPFTERVQENIFLLVSAIAFLVVLILLFIIFFSRISKTKIYQKSSDMVRGVWTGIKGVRNISNLPMFIVHSIFIWLMYFLMAYVCFFAIAETSHLGLDAGLGLLAMGSIAMLAPVQGGIGAYHWIASETLQLYNAAAEPAMALAFLSHGAQVFIILILGVASLILLPVLNRRKNVSKKTVAEFDTAKSNR